eukprot:g5492.t1
MPKLGQLETHLIRRVPNLKKMQLEKERLEQVDLENARLLKRIKKMGNRKTREFSKSSAAEDILPLVLQRRKRERKRKNKELEKSNLLMKNRIDKIKYCSIFSVKRCRSLEPRANACIFVADLCRFTFRRSFFSFSIFLRCDLPR